jgi:integrase
MGCIFKPKRSRYWWVKYRRGSKAYYESSRSVRKGDARRLLRRLEGDIERGLPVTPKVGRLKFEEAAKDLTNDFMINGKKSLAVVERRVRLHLQPYFEGRRMVDITAADIREYIAKRQADRVTVKKARTIKHADGTTEEIPAVTKPTSNAEINRELQALKRMFSLAIQSSKLLHKPYIPMLRESAPRAGFFEPEMFRAVVQRLPNSIQPIVQFAYLTGWRIQSEVQPLEWRQVDFDAGEVRLDPGTTKNRMPRTFPMTRELRSLLEAQRDERDRVKKDGHIVARVFFREVAEGRGGTLKPRPIIAFTKAWRTACVGAGCPGRIPHDLRRTAVRNLVRAGVPDAVAMQLTGHKTRSVFERYNIVSDSDLRAAADRINNASGTPSQAVHEKAQ